MKTALSAMASSLTIGPATAAQVGSFAFDVYPADSCIYYRAHAVGVDGGAANTFGTLQGRSERYVILSQRFLVPPQPPLPRRSRHVVAPRAEKERDLAGASRPLHLARPLVRCGVSRPVSDALGRKRSRQAHAATTVELQASSRGRRSPG